MKSTENLQLSSSSSGYGNTHLGTFETYEDVQT